MANTPTEHEYFQKPAKGDLDWDDENNGNWDVADKHLSQKPIENLLYNPFFEINQRGIYTKNSNGFFIDRWSQESGGIGLTTTIVDKTVGQDLPRTKTGTLLRVETDCSSAGGGDYAMISQHIPDLWKFQNQTVTVSFWALSNGADKDIQIQLAFHDGSSPQWGSTQGQVVTILDGVYQRYSVTMFLPSITGYTLHSGHRIMLLLNINNSVAGLDNASIYFSGMELVYGDVAMPARDRSKEEELELCLPFYAYYGTVITTILNNGTTAPNYCACVFPGKGMVREPILGYASLDGVPVPDDDYFYSIGPGGYYQRFLLTDTSGNARMIGAFLDAEF